LHAAQSVGAEIDEEGPTSPVEALSTKPVRRLLWTFRPIIQVVDARGGIVTLLGSHVPLQLDPPQLKKVMGRGKIAFQTVTTADSKLLRVAALRASHGGQAYAVEVAHPLDDIELVLQRIRWLLAAAALAILIAIVATDLALTRQVLRPIDAIVRQARRLNDASLAEPLPHPGEPGELARLVETLNAMLARIHDSVEAQRRFTADAAHELRSPLTRLRNDLDNAVKFSPPGGTIDVDITGTPYEICVTVSDMGPGIPEDELPRVFQRFFRGKSPRAMGASGVGLGLAIAQTLVQRQRGAIDIDSKPGSGTTVTIRLPAVSDGS